MTDLHIDVLFNIATKKIVEVKVLYKGDLYIGEETTSSCYTTYRITPNGKYYFTIYFPLDKINKEWSSNITVEKNDCTTITDATFSINIRECVSGKDLIECEDCKVSKCNDGGCDCQIITCDKCGDEDHKYNHNLQDDGKLLCDCCNTDE